MRRQYIDKQKKTPIQRREKEKIIMTEHIPKQIQEQKAQAKVNSKITAAPQQLTKENCKYFINT